MADSDTRHDRRRRRDGALVVEALGVTRRYGDTPALSGVDLSVGAGEVYGILGPNGAGKTTLLRIVLGLVRPDTGQVHVLGHAPGSSQALAHIGCMIETPAFVPGFTGRTNLLVLAKARGLGPREVDAALERVGLDGAAARKVKGYSLGMRQRLGVAAALLGDPPLLLLDEPTNGLDPAGVVAMRSLIAQIAAEGATVVVSSHVLSEIEQICGRVIVLQNGTMIANAALDDVTRGHESLEEAFFALTAAAPAATWTE